MSAFALLLLCLLIGVIAARSGRVPEGTPQSLNWWILHVALPALVLAQIPRLGFSAALLFPALAPWLVFGGAALLFPLLGRWQGWDRGTVGALILTCGLGNTAFMGLAMVEALRGPAALGPAVIADQLGSFLALSSGGVLVAALYGGSAPQPREILRRVLFFPPFIALIAGLVVRLLGGWPEPAEAVLRRLGETLVPLALFSVGLQFRIGHGGGWGPLCAGLGWKLAGAPLVVGLIALATGAGGLPEQVAVLQSGMAPMITAGILAIQSGLAPRLANRIVSLGILLSLATVPLLNRLL